MQFDGNGEEQGNSVIENNVENNDENAFNSENGDGEEMNFEDENQNNEDTNKNEEENGEKKFEERDSLKKTLTQNIDADVKKISENPNNIYYNNDNFCDYKPKEE